MRACACVRMCVCVCACVYACVHTDMQARIHILCTVHVRMQMDTHQTASADVQTSVPTFTEEVRSGQED